VPTTGDQLVNRMTTTKRYLSAAAIALLATSSAAYAQAIGEAMPHNIVVRALPGMSEADLKNLAAGANCEFVKPIPYCPNFYLFRLKTGTETQVATPRPPSDELKAAIAELKKTPGILADPDYIKRKTEAPRPLVPVAKPARPQQEGPKKPTRATAPPGTAITPNDPLYPRQNGLDLIRMPEAWNLQAGLRPVVAGIVDSGIDVGHEDFNDATTGATRIIGAANFTTNNVADVQDTDGHGTHVAGTVAATTGNGVGVASVAGWGRNNMDVRLRIGRVFNAPGGAPDSVIYAAVGYMIDNNVDVINMSLGGNFTSPIEGQTIQRSLDSKITVVAAAGNESTNSSDVPHFPSDLPGVIRVTAVNVQDNPTLAAYSNFGGPTSVTAPGGDIRTNLDEGIWSTWPRNLPGGNGITGYNSINGTSMASPHVAGVVALLIANGAQRDPAFIKATLESTAKPLPDENPNPRDTKYGAGLVDAYSALLTVSDPPFGITFADTVIDEGPQYSFQLDPFLVRVIGVNKKPLPGEARLEIQTATFPPTTVRTFTNDQPGGFTIPSLQPGQNRATTFLVSIPGDTSGAVTLAPGRYRAVLIVNGQEYGSKFFEIVERRQPIGRTLFSVPFKVRSVNPTNPETAVLGNSVAFTLARYNPLRLPSDFDYAIWQSTPNGRQDAAASFSATAPNGAPLTYELNDPTTSIAPVGLGYWLNLDQGVILNPVGPTVNNPVAIRLFAAGGGWNMIGAPFTGSAGWGTVSVIVDGRTLTLEEAIQQGVISPALVGYSQGDYFFQVYPAGTLEPFNGYWVRAYRDCTLVIAPTSISRAAAAPSRSVATGANGWRARLVATVAGDRDGQNFFGQVKGASNENDIHDISKPPSGGGHAYVRFLTGPEGRAVANAFDMRSLGETRAEWTAAVSTDRANAEVTLSWDGLGNAPNRAELVITDVVSGQKVNMRNRSSYTFKSGEAGATRLFKIALTPRATAGPLTISNVTVASAPGGRSVGSALTIRFNTNREADIVGTVKALNGKVVGTLTGTTRATPSGVATLRWDGRSRSGAAVPPGAYLVVIQAKDSSGTVATYTQPVQSIQ
jgi:subtilisin family serine protease